MRATETGRIVTRVHEVSVGDVIAYPGQIRRGWERLDTDWLTVTRIDHHGLHGTRVHPRDEEDDGYEYVVIARQVEDNGVEIAP